MSPLPPRSSTRRRSSESVNEGRSRDPGSAYAVRRLTVAVGSPAVARTARGLSDAAPTRPATDYRRRKRRTQSHRSPCTGPVRRGTSAGSGSGARCRRRGQGVWVGPADSDGRGAPRQCDHGIRRIPCTGVEHDRSGAGRRHDTGHELECRKIRIRLAATMISAIQHIGTTRSTSPASIRQLRRCASASWWGN